jgi:glycosyltransferase involved in cell wall biosynthesis
MAVAEGVQEKIDFRGMISPSELNKLYDECAALVMPTLHEAASGPVMEAFVRGVPVLCADIPSLRDQIEQSGGAVAWFDPMSVESLAWAVHTLKTDSERLIRGARRGGGWFAALSWPDTAERYCRVMDRCLIPR